MAADLGEKCELQLTPTASHACYWVLSNTECKERGAASKHRAIFDELKDKCMDMVDSFRGTATGGRLAICEMHMQYLKDSCEKRFHGQGGVPGDVAGGVDELMDLIEAAQVELLAKKKGATGE